MSTSLGGTALSPATAQNVITQHMTWLGKYDYEFQETRGDQLCCSSSLFIFPDPNKIFLRKKNVVNPDITSPKARKNTEPLQLQLEFQLWT